MLKEVIFTSLIAICLLTSTYALSEEAKNIEKTLESLESEIKNLDENGIPIQRINETFQEVKIEFESQKQLETLSRRYSYSIILEKIEEINKIKTESVEAKDRLEIFEEFYNTLSLEINLSEMDSDYQEIHNSFNDERFEETLTLIDEGYTKLSELHSSQTGASLLYNTARQNIKVFLAENWKILISTLCIILVLLIFFWKTLIQIRLRRQISQLMKRKQSINHLIKESQKNYFKKKKMSENEYRIKIKKYNELIRDIDRELPLLKERIARISQKKKQKNELN